LVALVVVAYGFAPIERLDASLLVHLSVEQESRIHPLASGIARLADPLPLLVMLVGICLLALSWGRRREALAAAAVVTGANLTTQALKVVLAHPRFQPYADYHQPLSDAFPSGHATAAASIGVALMLAAPPRLRAPAVLAGCGFAAAVGVSVVVLQWHFASDVAGAYLVAAGWGFAALAALRLARPPGRSPSRGAGGRIAVPAE
jgi:membrane-associated phospholipid phosphatase